MKIPSNGVSWKPVILLLLAALFAYLSIRASHLTTFVFFNSFIMTRMNLRWIFWLTTLLSIAFLLPLVNIVLQQLHKRSLLPKPLNLFYDQNFQTRVERFAAELRVKLSSLGGRLFVVGTAIMIVLVFLSSTFLIRDREVSNYLNEYSSGILGKGNLLSVPPTAVQMSLAMTSFDGTQYLKNCLKVVNDLKDVGAKAVLVDIRDVVNWKSETHLKLIDDLLKTHIVVFGVEGWISPRIKNERGVYTLRSYELAYNPLLSRIMPTEYGRDLPDVIISLLRKYRNYDDKVQPVREGSMLVFGDFRFPVTRDGAMYSRDRFGDPGLWVRMHATQFWRNDSAIMVYQDGVKTRTTLGDDRDRFAGRIVFLTRMHQRGFESFFFGRAYVGIMENVIQGTITRKVEFNPLWLAGVCVVISGLIAYKFRPLLAVLLIFLFGTCVLVGDSMLYDKANVLIEAVYPLLSILMTMVIFPALALVDRLGTPR